MLWRKYKKEQDFWNFKNITTGSNAKYTPIEHEMSMAARLFHGPGPSPTKPAPL